MANFFNIKSMPNYKIFVFLRGYDEYIFYLKNFILGSTLIFLSRLVADQSDYRYGQKNTIDISVICTLFSLTPGFGIFA
jgi:hypothetical protein